MYLFTNEHDEVMSIVHSETLLTEEEKSKAIVVDKLPTPNKITGKEPILKYDGTNLYYEYVDRPISDGERITQLESENAELLFKSALTEMEVETIKDENAELMFRIAMLEMGGIA